MLTFTQAQEREYIRASRNHTLTLTQRVRLAHRASDVHKMRTGRPLNITTQAVLAEDMSKEGSPADDLQSFAQARAQALDMAKGKVETILNKIHTTPVKAGALEAEAAQQRNPSSSSESMGRMTPNSIDEPSTELGKCSSVLARANTNHRPSSNEAAQAAILAYDLRNTLPKIPIPTRYSSSQEGEKTSTISTQMRSHIYEENTTNYVARRTFDRISINERFDGKNLFSLKCNFTVKADIFY